MSATNSYTSLAIGLVIVIAITGSLLVVLAWVRRRMKEPEPTGSGMPLAELRRLRDQGEITAEEFDRAKAKLLAGARRDLADYTSPDLARDRRGAIDSEIESEPKLGVKDDRA